MTVEITNRVWEQSRQSGDGLVLLLALSDSAGPDGQGHKPRPDYLARRVRQTPDELDVTLRKVCDAGELVWGLGAGLGQHLFVISVGSWLTERMRSVPGPRRAAAPYLMPALCWSRAPRVATIAGCIASHVPSTPNAASHASGASIRK